MGKVLGESSLRRGVRRFATGAATISLTLVLSGCAQNGELSLGLGGDQPKTADIATASAGGSSQLELEKATVYWGEQHAKNPRDPKAAVAYARNLKALGRKANALAALQATYMLSPDDKELLSEYGRLALDLGQVSTAEKLLIRAEDPAKPDWRIISARGTVFAKQGRFKESISFFEKALSLAPEQPSLMNNLAMAYTMDGQASRGEELLRRAASGSNDPRVQKNLELVMDLQGKSAAAQATASIAQPPAPEKGAHEPPRSNAAWNKPLPIERADEPRKVAANSTVSAPMDADEIVRRAIAAEHGETARQ